MLPPLALSVRQPKAYLAGCLKGDACISRGHVNSIQGYIQLRVADWDFATAFSDALFYGYGRRSRPRKDERGYALVRSYNGYGRYNELLSFVPAIDDEHAAWLRGLFDSEGNVVCVPKPTKGERSWDRRVAIFSTNADALVAAQKSLDVFSIKSSIKPWISSAGHLGTLPVMALVLVASKDNFSNFRSVVGSSIYRKQAALDKIPGTYCADLSQACREAQLRGVAVRKLRQVQRGYY